MALNSTPYPPPARTSRPGGLRVLSNPQTIDIRDSATSENTTVARGTSENGDTRYRIVRVKSVMDPLRRGGEGSYLLIEWSATYPRGEKRSKDSQIYWYDQKGNTSIIGFVGSLLDGFAVHGPVRKAFLIWTRHFEWNRTVPIVFDAFCGKNITIDSRGKD